MEVNKMAQAAQIDTKYFMGQGMVFLAEKNETTGEPLAMRHLGNVTDLKLQLKTTTIDLKEAMTGARGLAKRLTTENACTFSATLESLVKENLAIALRAAITDKVAGSATGETVTAFKSSLLPLRYAALVDDATLVVKSANGVTTYVKGTDYTVNTDSISIPVAGAIAALDTGDGVPLLIAYHYGAQTIVDAFTEPAKEYWLRFEGLNTAEENKSVIVNIFKISPDPLKELAMIGDKQAEISLDGACLVDSTRTGTDSRFFQEIIVE
jgi:hypothetical protein